MTGTRTTNWLLAGILSVLAAQVWLQLDHVAHADTFHLDDCITARLSDIPSRYVHVVSHAPAQSR